MNNILIALIGGLLAMFGYGISDFLAKKTIDKIGSFRTVLYVQIIGVFFLIFYIYYDRSLPLFTISNIGLILLFGALEAIVYLALYRSFELGKISIVSPIASSYVIVASVVSFFLFNEQFSQFKIGSLVLMILGILVVAYNKSFFADLKTNNWAKGVPEALIVLFINGLYVPFWDQFLVGSGWIVWVILRRIIMVLAFCLYGLLIKKQKLQIQNKHIWYWLILIAFFEAIGSFGNSWGYRFSIDATSIVAAISSTYPMITVVLARVFLGEKLIKHQYIGLLMIIIGIIASSLL